MIEVHCQSPVKANPKSSRLGFSLSSWEHFSYQLKSPIDLLVFVNMYMGMIELRKSIKTFQSISTYMYVRMSASPRQKCEKFPEYIYVCFLDHVCIIVFKEIVRPICEAEWSEYPPKVLHKCKFLLMYIMAGCILLISVG